ncbi:hypothetical protein K7459_12870 [Pseudomonas fluorescens]|uniref:Uncharacterized protein n=1 Tax=Pseudomonas fluorescens (strain Pf0-1) TaxID=205922 RepID=Q3KAI2_PSEPF|nr:hypothetical protein [Pseudomonas fluorescens]ABA75222.1 hypothetical protein Pfl01_3484 [Pseudomonas fluorescens Pf0-1]MBY9024559.1 hypothetical protein [Pseudomonas fluorescens]MBY9030926.1 hypothetical protein [Pseudomonas fluorescens]MBY9036929.1 hypothetical protein [Pseudomonas fluorescens]MBY9043035.1 hypothetical protein [Pseudomonas fluorescens]
MDKGILGKPVTRLQGIITALLLACFIAFTPIMVFGRIEDYEWRNGFHQKEIVEKRVYKVENKVSELEHRVQNAEVNISTQLALVDAATDRLQNAMYEADPNSMRKLTKLQLKEAEEKAAKGISIKQEASPKITVNPIINGNH